MNGSIRPQNITPTQITSDAAAMALAHRHIIEFDKYDTDIKRFRATRRELLEALSK